MGTHARTNELIEWLKQGKIMEAYEEFYDDGVEMQENAETPTVGKDANRTREKAFLASVKEWKSLGFDAVAVEEGPHEARAFIEYNFDFVNNENQPVCYEQVSSQRWRNGKIVAERFYYNPS